MAICWEWLGKTNHCYWWMDYCPKRSNKLYSKAMNAIFNAVSMEEFKRISNLEIAHTTWNILQTVHKGTKAVKINKLQLNLKVLECLKMSLLMNSMLNWMILLILLITWVKFMINLKLLGRFLDNWLRILDPRWLP